MLYAHVVIMLYAHVVIMLYTHVVIMLYAHTVIMLYAHVVSSYYCTLGLYACASVNPINSRDRPCRSPCVDYTTTFFIPRVFLHEISLLL